MNAVPWSATRARMFQECRRKYYYRYHLAPLGRKPDAPPEACQAFQVKDLIGLEAWAGDLVHRLIEEVLNRWRAGRVVAETEVLRSAKEQLSRQFRASQAFWEVSGEHFPKRPALLDLHYYKKGPLSAERAGVIKETVLQSLRSFLGSELAGRIRAVGRENWRPIDRNAAARLEGGVLVLVKPDFAFVEGDRLHIVDWKTGRPDPFWEMVQVTCYALYAQEKWGYALPQIVPQVAHLYPTFRMGETQYTPESVRDVMLFIRESQDELVSLLDSEDLPSAERFPLTEDCTRCRWCAFRGLCDGYKRVEGTD
jgi:hypothetical protein